jgi:hypothetical protein
MQRIIGAPDITMSPANRKTFLDAAGNADWAYVQDSMHHPQATPSTTPQAVGYGSEDV